MRTRFDQVKLGHGMLKDKLDEMATFYRGLSNAFLHGPVPSQMLHFMGEGCDALTFKSFYACQEHEHYLVYHATIRFP